MTLPGDTALTLETLKKATKVQSLAVHVGTAKWEERSWRGQIYPKVIQTADLLAEYVKTFNCVELNNTYYKLPSAATVAAWVEQARLNPDFKFCPRFHQGITQIRKLKDAGQSTADFYNTVRGLKDHLGPLLLQLPESFGPDSLADLEFYLRSLPKEIPVFTELSQPDWFRLNQTTQLVYSLLQELNIGSVISDNLSQPERVHMNLATPEAFIRFTANGDQSDYKRLDAWIDRIAKWDALGLESLWFFVHQAKARSTPALIDYFTKGLNKRVLT